MRSRNRRQVVERAAGEVVEDADALAVAHQRLRQIGADEARSAGDQIHRPLSRSSAHSSEPPVARAPRAGAHARARHRARRRVPGVLERAHARLELVRIVPLAAAQRPSPPFEELVAQLVGGRVRDPVVLADLVQRPLALDQLERDGDLLFHGQFLSQSHGVLPMTSAAAATRGAGAGVSPPRLSSRGGTVSGARQRPAKVIKPFRNPAAPRDVDAGERQRRRQPGGDAAAPPRCGRRRPGPRQQ